LFVDFILLLLFDCSQLFNSLFFADNQFGDAGRLLLLDSAATRQIAMKGFGFYLFFQIQMILILSQLITRERQHSRLIQEHLREW
jgi:hypothetical protein